MTLPLSLLAVARRAIRRIKRNRRLRLLITGRGELVGGPFDGVTRRTWRIAALSMALPEWGAVVRWANGSFTQHWPWTSKPDFEVTWPVDAVWLGNYDWYAFADCWVWVPNAHARTRSEIHREIFGQDAEL